MPLEKRVVVGKRYWKCADRRSQNFAKTVVSTQQKRFASFQLCLKLSNSRQLTAFRELPSCGIFGNGPGDCFRASDQLLGRVQARSFGQKKIFSKSVEISHERGSGATP